MAVGLGLVLSVPPQDASNRVAKAELVADKKSRRVGLFTLQA